MAKYYVTFGNLRSNRNKKFNLVAPQNTKTLQTICSISSNKKISRNMSRIGKIPVKVPEKITVTIDQNIITIKGPKGELSKTIPDSININQESDTIKVSTKNNSIKSQ